MTVEISLKVAAQNIMRQHFGIRPDEPLVVIQPDLRHCGEYMTYVTYSPQLMEAYHSRATQNRGWIYIAGITGLGVAAASGGLAAAAAVGVGTLGLLSISGGFASGTFATINNQDLATTYTIAANRVDTALKESERRRLAAANDCTDALEYLKEKVSEARVILEESRTNNAIGALDRAKASQKALNALIKEVEAEQNAAAAKITADPPTLSIDSAQDQTTEVRLMGGKTAYTVNSLPKNVKVTPVTGKTDTFTIVVQKDAEEGRVVFVDKSEPPLNVMVPVMKKTP
jgi:hypothetical protein